MLSDDFYRALEERFRGARETIKERQSVYMPVVTALHARVGKKMLDVGCGRGEWLELLTEHQIPVEGIDLNEEFVDAGRAAGYSVIKADAMQFLAEQPDGAYGLLSAFHVVEHLGFDNLLSFLREAYRVVDDGGAILLETPNPANLVVGACNFYIDPTHERPIPSVLLSFAAEYSGFESVVVVPVNRGFIQNNLELMPEQLAGATVINKVVSTIDNNLMQAPDYAVIAFKRRDPDLVKAAESLIDVSTLAVSPEEEESVDWLNMTVIEAQQEVRKWQERAYQHELRIRELELEASNARLEAESEMRKAESEMRKAESEMRKAEHEMRAIEHKAAEAEMEVMRLHEHIQAIYNSRSWRLSAPVRVGGTLLRRVGISRTGLKRAAKPVALRAVRYLDEHPALKVRVSRALLRFPTLRTRLRNAFGMSVVPAQSAASGEIESVDRLTARGRQIYNDLRNSKKTDV